MSPHGRGLPCLTYVHPQQDPDDARAHRADSPDVHSLRADVQNVSCNPTGCGIAPSIGRGWRRHCGTIHPGPGGRLFQSTCRREVMPAVPARGANSLPGRHRDAASGHQRQDFRGSVSRSPNTHTCLLPVIVNDLTHNKAKDGAGKISQRAWRIVLDPRSGTRNWPDPATSTGHCCMPCVLTAWRRNFQTSCGRVRPMCTSQQPPPWTWPFSGRSTRP